MARFTGPPWLPRLLALALMVVGVPALLGVSEFLQDTPIRVGEPSPRTVVAPDTIRVPDPEATERARREASEAVQPVFVDDEEAKAAIVEQVSDVFARASAARATGDGERAPSRSEQVEALQDRLTMLDEEGLALLVSLSDEQLQRVAAESTQIAQQFARQAITEDNIDAIADEQLPTELVLRPFPDGVDEQVVDPVIRDALRPTVRLDEAATADARRQAAGEVADVERSYLGGSVIVSAGETVDEVQFAALQRRGLEGREPWGAMLRGLLLSVLLTLAVAAYLRAYRPHVWRSGKRLLLLTVLGVLFAATLQAVMVTAPTSAWLYAVPVGAVAMLATILFDPPVGVLVSVPVTVLVAYTLPGEPGVVAFSAVAALGSVPLVSRLSARGDLRRAAWQSTLGYIVLAGAFALIFSSADVVPTALAAGLANGIMTAVILNGILPFLESVFGIVTATSLLDLADRNHPLLRDLEKKALGSYNHSIMVSTLVERASRRIGADALLGSVAALYHDIGKVAQPYFFVENQSGMANPHDSLDPKASALIIQRHVTDGLEMARTYRLPAEVVEGIATHHGTTRVSYFYQQAVNQAHNGQEVDEAHFRYKGAKPSTKEMAILMLADCCEGASRAAALTKRNLSREDLVDIVHNLVADRVEDGQLDEASLTFRELATVQESFIETLVGVYHPRIAYPEPRKPEEAAIPPAEQTQQAEMGGVASADR
ncbi:MAG TPA: HDIG domain-containing protein [Egibacteraceae bacterium]|nr:HDIG domain-containing protein [Egibacteraceae bacterium]